MLQQRIMLASPSRIASNYIILKIAGKKLIFKYTAVYTRIQQRCYYDLLNVLHHGSRFFLQSSLVFGASPLGPYYIGTASTNDAQYFHSQYRSMHAGMLP